MPTLDTLLSITAIALLQPVLGTITGCDNPGDHMCTVITAGGAFGNPVTGAISGSRYVDVGDGSCNSILSSGKLEPQSPGFYADLKTVYGTEIQYWADSIGDGDIRGINFHYLANDQWYYQNGCEQRQTGFDPSYTVVQCNFPC
ncbi:hypothetical protein DPV78_003961 [Talaromyces pinophilus]|nr:hypothetical protein DPV78_003961 [Talaromyces pinophilus]